MTPLTSQFPGKERGMKCTAKLFPSLFHNRMRWIMLVLAFLLFIIVDANLEAESILPTNDLKSSPAVSFAQRSFLIHGKPTLLLSGSIHYNRVPPSDWNSVFRLAKELGLNCIQTYVFWSEHEPYSSDQPLSRWEGYADLVRFLQLAAANDLYVVLRIGPYICGEYYFGGIPLWMRDIQDKNGRQIECFRCIDPLWEREMKRWVQLVVGKIQENNLLLTSNGGGPIIWMQIENEYDPDDAYLEWAVDMARNTTTDVPWSLCGHNIEQCNQLNGWGAASGGQAAPTHENRVVCTINGFWMEECEKGDQPSPTFFQKLWSQNPTQPAVWTEDQGWFDVWGMGKRVRSTTDQLYGMARFFAHGGSYHNFYMLTGGNNYEHRAGRDATTAYAPDTVIDNLLLRHEPRFSIFRKFFWTLSSIAPELLSHTVPASPIPLNSSSRDGRSHATTAEVHCYGNLSFLSNYGEHSNTSGYFDFEESSYFLPNQTVVLLDASSQEILFNTSDEMHPSAGGARQVERVEVNNWRLFREQVGLGKNTQEKRVSPEQLNFTRNKSDYMWYSFSSNQTGNIQVNKTGWGGLYYVYVDGRLLDSDLTGHHTVELKPRQRLVLQTYPNPETLNERRVDILSVAMGMNTVVSPQTGKGIESVMVGDSWPPISLFSTSWMLEGESMEIYSHSGAQRVDWIPIGLPPQLNSEENIVWLQGDFNMPKLLHPFVGHGQPNQTALVVNLRGLHKGVAYVNGFNLGRYWLVVGECQGECAPPRNHGPHCFLHWSSCGQPTQARYHVPFEILKETNNLLTVFEETASSKNRGLDDVFLEVIHDHHDIL